MGRVRSISAPCPPDTGSVFLSLAEKMTPVPWAEANASQNRCPQPANRGDPPQSGHPLPALPSCRRSSTAGRLLDSYWQGPPATRG